MAYIGTKIVDDCVMLSSWSSDHQNKSNGPSIDPLSSLCQTEAGAEAGADAGKEEENSTSVYQRDITSYLTSTSLVCGRKPTQVQVDVQPPAWQRTQEIFNPAGGSNPTAMKRKRC